jgi:diadenosine tetraphosphate (Ap4A) HIT family hydrolase
MAYIDHINQMKQKKICPFCEEIKFAIDENDTAFVLPARAPYTEDHLLICTKSHKKNLSELSKEELEDIQSLLVKREQILQDKYGELVIFLRQ